MQNPATRHEAPTPQADQPVSYEEWLAAEIEAGCAELDAGEGVAAEQVWQDLGLE
jgi:predicted transcriptional regulator